MPKCTVFTGLITYIRFSITNLLYHLTGSKQMLSQFLRKETVTLCNNYIGPYHSLTCITMGKILKHLIYSHMYIFSHLSRHNILYFCHSPSCEMQLLLIVNNFAKSLNKKTDTILLGFSIKPSIKCHKGIVTSCIALFKCCTITSNI